jgi:hypothetical protein
MNSKIFFPVISAIALVVASVIFASVVNNSPSVIAQSSSSSTSPGNTAVSTSNALDCSSVSSKIGAKAVPIANPNRDVCDVLIIRNSPQIIGHNGTVLNKFIAVNSLLEITPVPPNMTRTPPQTSSPSNPKVIAMGEFALLETELKPVLRVLARSDWNVTAVHNHPILEKPSMIFVHWDALGDLNTIVNQTKGALIQTSIAQGAMTGGSGGGGNTSSGATTTGQGANQTGQQQGGNQTQKGPLEQLGELFSGGKK